MARRVTVSDPMRKETEKIAPIHSLFHKRCPGPLLSLYRAQTQYVHKLVPERGGMGAVAVEAWGKESGAGAAGEAAGALIVGNTIRARPAHSLPSSSRGTYSPCASAA